MQMEQTEPSDDAAEAPTTVAQAGRPRFKLTDDQMRILVQQMGAIKTRHANSPRKHGPFVHDFVRAVYHATGKIYSAGIYRKLLSAHAPDRRPSTPTIEAEKSLLEKELQRRVAPMAVSQTDSEPADPGPATDTPSSSITPSELAQLEILGLLRNLESSFARFSQLHAANDPTRGHQNHIDYLAARLKQTDDGLLSALARATQLKVALDAAKELANERAREIELMRVASEKQTAAIAAMATEAEGNRLFALRAIDDVRGETRAVRERCTFVEGLLKEANEKVEQYRQMLMNRGGGTR